jgi:hypothetical protein
VRAGQFAALKKALGQIAKAYAYHSASNAVDGKRTQTRQAEAEAKSNASFLMGPEVGVTFSDFAIAARLIRLRRVIPKEEFEEIASWDGGQWGALIMYLDGEGYMKVDEGQAWQAK